MLLKSAAFTTVALMTLALGIGANTATFTLVNALLLKKLPIKAPQELVVVGDPSHVNDRWNGTPDTDNVSYPLYKEFRDNNTVFTGLLAAATESRIEVDLSGSGGPSDEQIAGRLVSGNYFSVLGVDPARGRLLTESDDTHEGANPVVVLSYSFWKNKFALSPAIIGKQIRLNGYAFTVVGVTQPNFLGDVVGENIAVFIPLSMHPQIIRTKSRRDDPNWSWLSQIGRLKPGVSIAQAKADINLIFQQALKGAYGARLSADDRKEIGREQIKVVPGGTGLSEFRGEYRVPVLLLMGIVGLVLLIACVNVANLLLARASVRAKEVAVRMAIGANRGRLLQQLLTESVLLAFIGGVCGAMLSIWGVRLLVKILGSDATSLPLSPDLRVLAFNTSVCLLTGILFGVAPALRSLKVQVSATLKDTAAPESRFRFAWGKGLVAGQVTLSLVVLFAASLLVRSLQNLMTQEFGFNTNSIVVAHVNAAAAGYGGEKSRELAQRLTARLATLPGVRAVTYSRHGLFAGSETSNPIIVPGFSAANPDDRSVREDSVGPDYFAVVGTPILLGRGIGPQDTATTTRIAVVNEAMMKYFFHGENPIGRQFEIDSPEEKGKPFTVIGVSKDAKDHPGRNGDMLREAVPPRFFFAYQQDPRPPRLILEISTTGDPNLVVDAVRRQIKAAVPGLPINSVGTVRQQLEGSMDSQIALAKLSAFFAILALLLACIGLYGIMSYTVASRTREIGVRIALGAQRGDVLQLVVGEGMLLVGAGLVAGVPLSLASSRLLDSFLFGLKHTDPVSLFAMTALLGVVALIAGFIPGRRATKVDPMVALRYE